MIVFFSGGPENLQASTIKKIGEALAQEDFVELCFSLAYAPPLKDLGVLKTKVLLALRTVLAASRVRHYAPEKCDLIDLPANGRLGLWIVLKSTGLTMTFGAGPASLSRGTMKEIAQALKIHEQIVIYFLITLRGQDFPWEEVSTVLADKLKLAGVGSFSVNFSLSKKTTTDKKQRLRVTIRSMPLQLPPNRSEKS